MELKYLGPESNRTSEDSQFLIRVDQTIKQLVYNSRELENEEVKILDIGCGTEVKSLSEIKEQIEITDSFTNNHSNYSLYAISSSFEYIPEGITTFQNYLKASEGLSFLPENLKFDYIYSSWCMNYLGPNTFSRVLADSLERLKPYSEIDIHPFQPVRNSSAYPYGLNIGNEIRELFYENPNKDVEYLKKRINTLATVLNIEIEDIENVSDASQLENIFNRNFLADEISQLSKDVVTSYSTKIFKEKERRLKRLLRTNYLVQEYHSDGLKGINIRKLY